MGRMYFVSPLALLLLLSAVSFIPLARGEEQRGMRPDRRLRNGAIMSPPLAVGKLSSTLRLPQDEMLARFRGINKNRSAVAANTSGECGSLGQDANTSLVDRLSGIVHMNEFTYNITEDAKALYFNVTSNTRHFIGFTARSNKAVEVVVQLMDGHFDPDLPHGNGSCSDLFISAQVNEVYKDDDTPEHHAIVVEKDGERMILIDNATDNDGDGDSIYEAYNTLSTSMLIWNTLAGLLDTSAFCDMLPTFMMRVPSNPEPKSYYIIVNARASAEFKPTDDVVCVMRAFAQEVQVEDEKKVHIIFALVLPLVVLVITIPLTFPGLHLVPTFMGNTDVLMWLIWPASTLSEAVARLVECAYGFLWKAYADRRAERRQKELLERHRRLMEETAESVICLSADNEDEKKNTYKEPKEKGFASESSPATKPPQENNVFIDASSDGTKSNKYTSLAQTKKVQVEEEYALELNASASDQPLLGATEDAERHDVKVFHSERMSGVPTPDGLNEPGDTEDDRTCRICRDDEVDESVISPCECIGSVRWVHRSCLDEWRISSVGRNKEYVRLCEICRKPFRIGISRHKLLWKIFLSVSRFLLLLFMIVAVFSLSTVGLRITLGEMTCHSPWRRVSYSTMFRIDGLVLTSFMYLMLTILAAFSYALTYSRWRTRMETVVYILEFQMLPPFWTVANAVKLFSTFLVGLLQAFSLGLLVKFLVYRTSYIAWSWEASPCIGAVLYVCYIAPMMGVATVLHWSGPDTSEEGGLNGAVAIERAAPAEVEAAEEERGGALAGEGGAEVAPL
ncbi:RING variant domain [Trypanosoma vivax]|uniref:Uncharacterized protein n=1 Tax=Trypanosoma vivax (strain Y486) TaxID=1055687 RepID=G0TUW9_TRYVY|nr:hypothetical protein TRVL_01409 [Trypanosoma vivax]KAH8617677.1 RING variant domain [Trypanosoma vivax]CCC47756.1 conserved hypothetical protein [Trypanosoma vivax Y486]